MSSVYCMVTITGRNHGERFSSLFKAERLPVMLLTLGTGTASSEMLDYFGMESREKIVIFTVVTQESWHHVKGRMEQKLNIDVPGTGISFIVPVSSVGGGKAFRYLLAGQEYEKEEESELKNTEYELLIVISNYGYNNLVMTFIVARSEKKNEIMKSIMEKAGMESKAKSILFSLPVTETAGLRISGDWKG
mgnify:CR=1 FL=1